MTICQSPGRWPQSLNKLYIYLPVSIRSRHMTSLKRQMGRVNLHHQRATPPSPARCTVPSETLRLPYLRSWILPIIGAGCEIYFRRNTHSFGGNVRLLEKRLQKVSKDRERRIRAPGIADHCVENTHALEPINATYHYAFVNVSV